MKVNKRIVATFRQLDTGWAKHKQTQQHFVQTKSPQMIKKKSKKEGNEELAIAGNIFPK